MWLFFCAPEKLLAEVNEKLAIVFTMKKTLEAMSDDISFYAEKYQELIEDKCSSFNRTLNEYA